MLLALAARCSASCPLFVVPWRQTILQEIVDVALQTFRNAELTALLHSPIQGKARADDDRSLKTVFVIAMENHNWTSQQVFRFHPANFPEPQRPVHQLPG